MFGELVLYNKNKRLSLFESNPSLPNKFVFIGGLTDGLMALPYLELLSKTLSQYNYSLIQPVLSSSYLGYGKVNLKNDVEELDDLFFYLIKRMNFNSEESKSSKIILMGHSTGAQDAMYYIKYGKYKNILSGIILQGAVSDREYAIYSKGKDILYKEIEIAKELVKQGKGHYYMPAEVDEAPITAYRFLSLNDIDGIDDMFSTDLSDEKLGKVFLKLDFEAGIHTKYADFPIVLISSEGDEYVPDNIDIIRHTKRMQELAVLKCWSKDGYNKRDVDFQLNDSSSYSIDILSKQKKNNVFINEESAIEVAAIIPNARHAIEEELEQQQLMEIILLLLKKIDK